MLLTAEKFTQHAYLQTAAVRSDSQVEVSEAIAFVRTPSSPERWMNSVVRMLHPPERFSEVDALCARFEKNDANFNWHVWPSSHPKLLAYLTQKKGLVNLGCCDFLTKPADSEKAGFLEPLSEGNLSAYLDAKLLGWGNDPKWREEMERAARFLMRDPRNHTGLLKHSGRVIGAVSSHCESEFAYLRGDFVIPEFRGRGLYREMILTREATLKHCGIKTLCVIADESSSSPIYRKLGYQKRNEIVVLAKRKTSWVSL